MANLSLVSSIDRHVRVFRRYVLRGFPYRVTAVPLQEVIVSPRVYSRLVYS